MMALRVVCATCPSRPSHSKVLVTQDGVAQMCAWRSACWKTQRGVQSVDPDPVLQNCPAPKSYLVVRISMAHRLLSGRSVRPAYTTHRQHREAI